MNLKKIILTVLVGLPIVAFSQNWRTMDLSAKFISPQHGAFYKLPNTVEVVFQIKNLGPDTMFPGDSILYSIRLEGNNTNDTILTFNKMFLPLDSIIIYQSVPFPDPPFTNIGMTWLRFYSAPFPRNRNRAFAQGPIDSDYDIDRFDNNKDTVLIDFRSSRTSIEDVANNKVKTLFPNPVKPGENLTLKGSTGKIKYMVFYDMFGKVVGTIQNTAPSDILSPDLPGGIYVVRITMENNETILSKIMIE